MDTLTTEAAARGSVANVQPLSVTFSPDESLLTFLYPDESGQRQIYCVNVGDEDSDLKPRQLVKVSSSAVCSLFSLLYSAPKRKDLTCKSSALRAISPHFFYQLSHHSTLPPFASFFSVVFLSSSTHRSSAWKSNCVANVCVSL